MAVVIVIGAGLGWYIHQIREQRLAVQAIRARGGIIEYDYRYDAVRDRRLPNGKSWCPVWLQHSLGDDDFLHNVAVVGLDVDKSGHDIRPTDADLVHLEGLHHLKILYLGGGWSTRQHPTATLPALPGFSGLTCWKSCGARYLIIVSF
jgi:hypothetical protein